MTGVANRSGTANPCEQLSSPPTFGGIHVALYPEYQDRMVGIRLTGLTPPHFCNCPKTAPGLETQYVVVHFLYVS
jgi:hypothetical protein